MDEIFRLAGALLVLLAVFEALFRRRIAFLPLGGDHIVQTGIVLGFAFVVFEVTQAVHW